MSNQTPAYVRTGTPISAGVVLAIAAHRLGLALTVEETALLTGALGAAWYVLGRALETWHPALGYILGVAKQPAYSTGPAPSPGADEAVEAVVVPEGGEVGVVTLLLLAILLGVALLLLGVGVDVN